MATHENPVSEERRRSWFDSLRPPRPSYDSENNLPKSPMHPSHLPSISRVSRRISQQDSLVVVPEPALDPGGIPEPAQARLTMQRPPSDFIDAEIRRVTTPRPFDQVSRRGSSDSMPEPASASGNITPIIENADPGLSGESDGRKGKRKKWWWQNNKALQARMIAVVLSGGFLAFTLAIYLTLVLTHRLTAQQFHILMILVLLLITLIFCHALARLCIAAARPLLHPTDTHPDPSSPSHANTSRFDLENQPNVLLVESGGYVVPVQPIAVSFPAAEQEFEPKETTTTPPPPPAYGLWRCSIRVNPDQFYWVRRESGGVAPAMPDEETGPHDGAETTPPSPPPLPRQTEQTIAAAGGSAENAAVQVSSSAQEPRPPSYVSEEGVDYVLAGPRPAGTAVVGPAAVTETSNSRPQSETDPQPRSPSATSTDSRRLV